MIVHLRNIFFPDRPIFLSLQAVNKRCFTLPRPCAIGEWKDQPRFLDVKLDPLKSPRAFWDGYPGYPPWSDTFLRRVLMLPRSTTLPSGLTGLSASLSWASASSTSASAHDMIINDHDQSWSRVSSSMPLLIDIVLFYTFEKKSDPRSTTKLLPLKRDWHCKLVCVIICAQNCYMVFWFMDPDCIHLYPFVAHICSHLIYTLVQTESDSNHYSHFMPIIMIAYDDYFTFHKSNCDLFVHIRVIVSVPIAIL